MKMIPLNLVGRMVVVILTTEGELEGECIHTRHDNDGGGHIMLRDGPWEYTIEAEAIAAIGVNREDAA